MGCDLYLQQTLQIPQVSIHAPAWGATRASVKNLLGQFSFNPRTRMGCDKPFRRLLSPVSRFQSTHPHGVRPIEKRDFVSQIGFNPRTRMGCDMFCNFAKHKPCSFNPRTRMGCDISLSLTASTSISFNPRTRMGCDQGEQLKLFRSTVFQSTHPHGVRLAFNLRSWQSKGFNPRTRMGCDTDDMRFIWVV